MFHRHFDDHIRHGHGGFGRGPFGGWRGRHGGFERREGRMFDGGELRLVILRLVAEKPRYGYEIIKDLGERVGAIFAEPRRRLSDADHARGDGLRQREPGPAGPQALHADARRREGPCRQQGPDRRHFRPLFRRERRRPVRGLRLVKRAMLNLRATLRLRLRGRAATPEQIQAIVDALDAAAKAVERS